jgi:hypothetical protein
MIVPSYISYPCVLEKLAWCEVVKEAQRLSSKAKVFSTVARFT